LPEAPGAGAHGRAVTEEFERVAASFAERTSGRFDHMGAVRFARVGPDATVAEVGAGTGNFLSLFAESGRRLIAVDLTIGMLREAAERHGGMSLVGGDGARLPFASRSIDLVACAQVLHHVPEPLPFVAEMRRVCSPHGNVLIVDQAAPEHFEQAVAMSELEFLRDPTHAASRPPSAFRIMLAGAGLRLVDERIVASRQRFSDWMWPGEFPESRIAAVKDFIERRGAETGMGFERDGDDYVFERHRIMLLAERG
jgi:ubiquinone/menaquinone biosynthesis C-methylase UbiE